jgi:ArsR family transcriptional regulator
MIHDSDFFNVLSDETRRRMLALLMMEEELSVCELCFAVDCAQPKVSRHLAKMRQSKLLSVRRDGVWMYYRVNPQLPAWAFKIVQQMTQAGECAQLLIRDRNRLTAMPDRPARDSHQVYATASVTPLQSRLPGAPIEAGVRIVR